MRLQCRAQEYSGHHGTFMLHCYIISEYNILCFFYLSTCSSVGPLEDTCAWLGGSARKRQRVDSEGERQRVDSEGETHLKKLRAWANEWPIPGRAIGTLEVFYDC